MRICVLVARFWLPAKKNLRVVGIPVTVLIRKPDRFPEEFEIQIHRHDHLKGILVKIRIFKKFRKNHDFLPGKPLVGISGYRKTIYTMCQKRFLTFSHLLENLFNIVGHWFLWTDT
jgi:hypothetical protein